MGTIEVPSDVYDALNVPDDKRDDVLRNELAISLYREGILSFGKARELAPSLTESSTNCSATGRSNVTARATTLTTTSSMRNGDLVVSDTSPLLNLALIDRLDLVGEQFSTVTVPQQVWNELLAGEDGVDALRSVRDAGGMDIVNVQ
nr:UPF0175 family protein [Natrinema sp. CBA1119]